MTDVESADSTSKTEGIDHQYTRAMLMLIPRARRVDEDLDASKSLDRCGDELAVVVDEDLTHRIVNPRAPSPTVGAKCRGVNRR